MCIGCLFSNCCFTSLSAPRGVHVDADGGCGSVPSISRSVCQTQHQTLHCCIYYIKLWLVNERDQDKIIVLGIQEYHFYTC